MATATPDQFITATEWLALAQILDDMAKDDDVDTDADYGAPKVHDLGEIDERFEGWTITFKAEPDPDYSINDYESDGRIEWSQMDRDTGYSVRPKGFNGAARIIQTDYPCHLWWQPWEGATPKQAADNVRRIKDLIECGFADHGTELEAPWGTWGLPVAMWLGGTEWNAPADYVRTLYQEQLSELADQLRAEHPAPPARTPSRSTRARLARRAGVRRRRSR